MPRSPSPSTPIFMSAEASVATPDNRTAEIRIVTLRFTINLFTYLERLTD